MWKLLCCKKSVSYTHLDVYKRQTDEQRDGDFYNELSKLNKDPIDSRLLNDMFLNERRHEKMLENRCV